MNRMGWRSSFGIGHMNYVNYPSCRMGRMMTLYVATKVSVMKPRLDTASGFHDVKGPQGTLDTVAGMRAKGEVGVHREPQDLRGSVQWGHLVSDMHLWVEPGLVVCHCVWTDQCVTLDFWGALASCFPSAHLTKVEQS